jgi:hypothetical protein
MLLFLVLLPPSTGPVVDVSASNNPSPPRSPTQLRPGARFKQFQSQIEQFSTLLRDHPQPLSELVRELGSPELRSSGTAEPAYLRDDFIEALGILNRDLERLSSEREAREPVPATTTQPENSITTFSDLLTDDVLIVQ